MLVKTILYYQMIDKTPKIEYFKTLNLEKEWWPWFAADTDLVLGYLDAMMIEHSSLLQDFLRIPHEIHDQIYHAIPLRHGVNV